MGLRRRSQRAKVVDFVGVRLDVPQKSVWRLKFE